MWYLGVVLAIVVVVIFWRIFLPLVLIAALLVGGLVYAHSVSQANKEKDVNACIERGEKAFGWDRIHKTIEPLNGEVDQFLEKCMTDKGYVKNGV